MTDIIAKYIKICAAIIISAVAVIFAFINTENNWYSMKLGLLIIIAAQIISFTGIIYIIFDKNTVNQSEVSAEIFRKNLMRGSFREAYTNFQEIISHFIQPNFYRYTQIIALPSITAGFLIVLISIMLR